jgi:SpoVK/Ycf46/Vps4 family AAA+-type ATPase
MDESIFLIPFSKELATDGNRHYYDYAFVIQKVKQYLSERTGLSFRIYNVKTEEDEIWDTIVEDLKVEPKKVEKLIHIYDCVSTGEVRFNSKKQFEISPPSKNTLYYYPEFQVAFGQIPIYQATYDYEEELIFSTSDQAVSRFLEYIHQRQRETMQKYINIFVDTEDDGVQKRKEELTSKISREDIFLESGLKEEIYRSIDEFFMDNGSFFKKYQIPYKRGILLYGKPGNGKTTLVKSIAGSISAPVVYWQITEFTNSYSIDEVFSKAVRLAPIVLVIEDIDSMPEGVRSYFLNTLDGAVTREGIFLIGTTNYPERIDPALINRAGRFDRAYELCLPNAELRRQYLEKKKIQQFISIEDLEDVVKKTEGFSFAQLNELYTSLALQYHYEQQANADRIIALLQADNKKGKRKDWNLDPDMRLGFF